ncbi:T9SS type A sorting domain-containing protein [Pontibacter sp. HJ8]
MAKRINQSGADIHRIDIKGIRVKGFTAVKIKWLDSKTNAHNNSATSDVSLFYSIDGGTYTKLSIASQNATDGVWRTSNNGNYIQLPAIPATATTINFYWSIELTRQEDHYGIDNIELVGTNPTENDIFSWATRPANEDPFVASSPAAATPYKLDNVAMRWTRSTAGTTSVTTALVKNEQLQAPNKTLTLVQTGASATQGTTVNVRFDDPMANLKFTLFDVDQQVGQVQDRLVITGLNSAGKTVLLKNEHVQRGSTINFDAATGAITGASGTDIAATSSLGDVVFMFDEPVQQVTIAYYNLDAAKGSQGLGIYQISGMAAAIIAPLPVKLVSFKGAAQDGGAKLTWSTATEIDNDKFVVERSQDGKTFKAIGEVKGNGNSNMLLHYSFTDTAPLAGTNYYRLKQTDFDGQFEYTRIVALHVGVISASSVYPTLAASEVTVRLQPAASGSNVAVLDLTGKQVALVQNYTDNQLVLPVDHLKSGVYFVTVYSGSQKETLRFVKK